ncbi:hypothetical protein PBI_SCTP2_91 [Salicola phage SCTP-2]|nr:hypothetical protein PBI_SCTP2_91 [Salicola phage SCTP-2]
MNVDDLNDNSKDKKEEENKYVKTKRGARLTMGHLLKLRRVKEEKKLSKLKDLELYYVMYGPGGDGGDEGGGF